MDPKVRPTHYKPMTPSINSSGSTVFVKPKKQSCVLLDRLGFLTLMDRSWILPPGAGSYREKQNSSRWTSQTVIQTVVWTRVRSASTVSTWNRQTLPVGTAGMWKAASDRSMYFLEVALCLILYSVCIPHMEQFGKALFNTFVTMLTQSLVSVPLSLVL